MQEFSFYTQHNNHHLTSNARDSRSANYPSRNCCQIAFWTRHLAHGVHCSMCVWNMGTRLLGFPFAVWGVIAWCRGMDASRIILYELRALTELRILPGHMHADFAHHLFSLQNKHGLASCLWPRHPFLTCSERDTFTGECFGTKCGFQAWSGTSSWWFGGVQWNIN